MSTAETETERERQTGREREREGGRERGGRGGQRERESGLPYYSVVYCFLTCLALHLFLDEDFLGEKGRKVGGEGGGGGGAVEQ